MQALMFNDAIVRSSDLNRRSGKILAMASQHPVTITRSGASLVLMLRSEAARLVQAASVSRLALRVLAYVLEPDVAVRDGSWMESMSPEDWQAMGQDLERALELPQGEKAEAELRAVLHEWRESMAVLSDPEMMRGIAQARRVAADSTRPKIPAVKPSDLSDRS